MKSGANKTIVIALILSLACAAPLRTAAQDTMPSSRSAAEAALYEQDQIFANMTEEEREEEFAAYAKKVIALTNEARKAEGLAELKTFEDLNGAAQLRAVELGTLYSHTRPSGEKWSTIFKELGLKSKARAENIAWGYTSPESVAVAWLESKGHRKNIMNETYNYIAVAVHVTETGELAWEQLLCK